MGHRDSSTDFSGTGAFRADGSGARPSAAKHRPKSLSIAARILLLAIRGYQVFFSASMFSACKFYPSCSQYAANAIQLHGARRGSWFALRRLARCHPFTRGGVDLVPDAAENPRGRNSLGKSSGVRTIGDRKAGYDSSSRESEVGL